MLNNQLILESLEKINSSESFAKRFVEENNKHKDSMHLIFLKHLLNWMSTLPLNEKNKYILGCLDAVKYKLTNSDGNYLQQKDVIDFLRKLLSELESELDRDINYPPN